MPRIRDIPRALRVAAAGAAVLVGLPLLFIFVSAAYRSIGWHTVFSEKKPYAQGAASFGYSIKRPWGWSDNFLLTFSGDKFFVQLESPGTSLKSDLYRRWSC